MWRQTVTTSLLLTHSTILLENNGLLSPISTPELSRSRLSWLFLPLLKAATPHGPRTHPSTLTTLTMHLRINGLKECSYTLYKERTTTPTTSVTSLTFHIPSSLLIYVTPMSPYHPTASSTSCLYTNSTYTTSHSLVHLKHNLDPYLEYSNTPLYINFRQLYF